jgi:hypothetical protein
MKQRGEQGVAMAVAFIVAILMGAAVLFVADTYRHISQNKVYLDGMYHAYRLAETGMTEAVGQLTINPDAYLDPAFNNTMAKPTEGRFDVQVFRRDWPNVENGYYIVTSATRTIHGRQFATRLHTYAQITNVGDYFVAVNDTLNIVGGRNMNPGKVYGKSLQFDTSAVLPTSISTAVYVDSCSPATHTWTPAFKSQYNIALTPDNVPFKLSQPLLFPQLLDSDIQRYASKAHLDKETFAPLGANAHKQCNFSGNIYPPGYVGNAPPNDSNLDHVYFCGGDMTIEGVIHGQIVFVSTGNIIISSSVVSSTDPNFPGQGSSSIHVGSSTAHQGVFITRQNIIIANTFLTTPTTVPPLVATQRIEGLFISPNGTIVTQLYTDPAHLMLALNFNGAMILGSNPPISSVFKNGGTTYSYMTTLQTNPPPDLPNLAGIDFTLEETFGEQR